MKEPAEITLRDYFAAQALQGLCAHGGVWGDQHAAEIAQSAYRAADAMLAERNKGREEE